MPNVDGAAGAMCGPAGALGCDAGLGCFGTDLEDGDAGTCQLWCAPGEALPDGCATCIPLTDEIGTCADCSVLLQDCDAGEICNPVNEFLGGACVPAGPATTGMECTPYDEANNCEEGNLCIDAGEDDVAACVETCDPTAPACVTPDATCVDLAFIVDGAEAGLLGVCIEGAEMYCDPDADPTGCVDGDECLGIEAGVGVCGAGCDPTEGDAACMGNSACFPMDMNYFNPAPFVEGNGACGVGCSNDGECGGGTCLLTDGLESDGICGTTCTPPVGAECAMDELCVATAGDPMVGACVQFGDACDPDELGGNCMEPAACVVVDGGGAAFLCAAVLRAGSAKLRRDDGELPGQDGPALARRGLSWYRRAVRSDRAGLRRRGDVHDSGWRPYWWGGLRV